MKSGDKDKIMTDFKERRYDILVSTVIIEVGIDVPNATVMAVEHAERFDLPNSNCADASAGEAQSFACFWESQTSEARERLRIMTKTCDGFKIAEMDFKTEGSG